MKNLIAVFVPDKMIISFPFILKYNCEVSTEIA